MVTWQEARQIVYAALRPSAEAEARDPEWRPRWDPSDGTFCVAAWGYHDDQFWNVPYGAREYVVDHDAAWMMVGDPIALVDRETGALEFTTFLLDPDRFAAMRPVGTR